MGRQRLKANDTEGFLRAMTDEWAELVVDHTIRLDFCLEPSGRKGVLRFTLRAYEISGMPVDRCVGRYTCEYPTASVGTLEACLYQCMIRLGRVLRDADRFPLGRP